MEETNRVSIIEAIDRRMDLSKMVFSWRNYNGDLRIGCKQANEVLGYDDRFMDADFIAYHQLMLVEKIIKPPRWKAGSQ